MSEMVFCEQCGQQITANAKFCRGCGAVQELVSEAAASATGTAGTTAPGAGGGAPTAAATTEFSEKLDSLRQLTERELSSRADSAFPGRSWQQVAGAAVGGGSAAFAAAWGIAWLILRLIGDGQAIGGLQLDQLSRVGVDLALGTPLVISGAISSFGGETELRLPLTLLVLIPLAGLTLGGYLGAGWFRPATRTEGWKIGATIAIPFAIVLALFSVSFGAHVPLIAPSFEGGFETSSASAEVHADGFYTILYGLFWGVLGGALGGWLQARRTCPPGDARAALVKTHGSSSPTVAIESAVRALGIPVLGFTALAVAGCIVLAAIEGTGGLLLLIAVPALVIDALFLVQGIGYDAKGSVSVGGALGATESRQQTFHVWDNGIVLIVAVALAALVIIGLIRGGRRMVHAGPAVDAGGAMRAGAVIAIPWLVLLLILRELGSLSFSASGLGIFQGGGSVAPAFGQTILFGGLFGAVFGGFGGWLAWRERQILATEDKEPDPVTNPLVRKALGDVDAPLPEVLPGSLLPPVRVHPPNPAATSPAPTPTTPAPAAIPPSPEPPISLPSPEPAAPAATYCEGCGNAMGASDRFCDRCGRQRSA